MPEPPVAKTSAGLLSIQISTDDALLVDQVIVEEQVVLPMAMLQGLGAAPIEPDGAGVGVGVGVLVLVGVSGSGSGVGVLVLVGVGVLVLVGVGVLVLVGVLLKSQQ